MLYSVGYNTAEEAFESLNIGENLDKRHIARKCKEIEKALHWAGNYWTKWATANDYTTIFGNHSQMPFNKSIKIGQVNGTNGIVVFGDQYDRDKKKLIQLRDSLSSKGISIEPFIYSYPQSVEHYYFDRDNVKMICDGYEYLYRGNLCGFVIEALN